MQEYGDVPVFIGLTGEWHVHRSDRPGRDADLFAHNWAVGARVPKQGTGGPWHRLSQGRIWFSHREVGANRDRRRQDRAHRLREWSDGRRQGRKTPSPRRPAATRNIFKLHGEVW